jgi:hypothetical protein
MPTVGENGIHEIQVTSKSDNLKGDAIRVEYVPQSGDDSITRNSVIGGDVLVLVPLMNSVTD